MNRLLVFPVFFAVLTGVVRAEQNIASVCPVASHKIAQLDLARQMETTTFVSNWLTRVSELGYDMVRLYLEARVATKTFSLPRGERYTAAEMKALVRHASSKGVVVMPSLQFYGHAEQFFLHPGLEDLAEEKCGRFRLSPRPQTFCYANPKTRDFVASYIDDLAEIFPADRWYVGFDEAWNSGLCDVCFRKDRNGGEAFLEALLFVRECLAKHGKRAIIADDFIDFFPGLYAKIPKDVMFGHWCYDRQVSTRGTKFNFSGRHREDHLAKYADEGREEIVTVWTNMENLRSYVRYAKRYRPYGFVISQWEELKNAFHGGSYPRLVAAGMMLDAPEEFEARDVVREAVKRTFPSLVGAEIDAAATLLHSEPPMPSASIAENLVGFPRVIQAAADRLAISVLRHAALRPSQDEVAPNPFSERAFLDDLVMRGEIGLVDEALRRAVPMLTDPRRGEADAAAAKKVVRELVPEIERLIARRERQHDLWRRSRR